MNDALEYQRAMALAASDSGRLAEAYRLWLPLVEAGDPEAQGAVGSLLVYGLHRFENYEQLKSATRPAVDEATTLESSVSGVADNSGHRTLKKTRLAFRAIKESDSFKFDDEVARRFDHYRCENDFTTTTIIYPQVFIAQ